MSPEFWADLIWQLQTCEEAMEVFPEALECPVCGERAFKDRDGEFHLLHKPEEFILN